MSERIQSMWVGGQCGPTEIMTMKSFLRHGHDFDLYVYDKPGYVPEGVCIRDAREILPESSIFHYPKKGLINWGKGSYAGFSDIFRYKLLYDKGGWWVDMDVTCLKPFDFTESYFFRNHWKHAVVGNVMKAPPQSPLMKYCFERATAEVTEHNTDWDKPISILNEGILKYCLSDYRRLGLFNLDVALEVKLYMEYALDIPVDWYGIHWINSQPRFQFSKKGTYYKLLQQIGV